MIIELVAAGAAAYGAYLLYTAWAFGWTGVGLSRQPRRLFPRTVEQRLRQWLTQAGLTEVGVAEFVGVVTALGLLGAITGFLIFGAPVPASAIGLFSAISPVASYRLRRELRKARSSEAWPRMIEEIRVRTESLGRSIPQALFEVGARAPLELRPAFEAAHREWVLTTDFERTVGVLKAALGDPTADVTCETLLVAHQIGGADLGRRLDALADDRTQDVQGRKDARARQAGARLARRFVIVVPIGMALMGMQIGDGRAAYATTHGQIVVVTAIAMVVACWAWAGRIMRLPEPDRVFA